MRCPPQCGAITLCIHGMARYNPTRLSQRPKRRWKNNEKQTTVKAGPVQRDNKPERLLQRNVTYRWQRGNLSGHAIQCANAGDSNTNWGVKSLVALDMPFTAVMDTLLLPWDMFRTDSSIKSRVEKSEKATLATNSVIPPAPMPAQ